MAQGLARLVIHANSDITVVKLAGVLQFRMLVQDGRALVLYPEELEA